MFSVYIEYIYICMYILYKHSLVLTNQEGNLLAWQLISLKTVLYVEGFKPRNPLEIIENRI